MILKQNSTPVQVIPPPPLVDLAKAYAKSLETTLANSMRDNSELQEKLRKVKIDLEEARLKNMKLADYNEWFRKAQLGYQAGFDEGAKQVPYKSLSWL